VPNYSSIIPTLRSIEVAPVQRCVRYSLSTRPNGRRAMDGTRELIDRLRAELEDGEKQLHYWQRRVGALTKAVDALEELEEPNTSAPRSDSASDPFPTSTPPPADDAKAPPTGTPPQTKGDERQVGAPRGREAALLILQDQPEQWFSVRQAAEEYRRRGWLPQSSTALEAVRMGLVRAYDAGFAERNTVNGRLVFRYRQSGTESPPIPPEDGDRPGTLPAASEEGAAS
jgi:hypothetical protein